MNKQFSKLTMLKRGIDISAYRSKGLKRPMVEEANLIIVFDECPPYRKATILSLWPPTKEKVFTFREFVEAEVKREYLATEDPYTAPCADEASIDFPAEFLEANIAETEGYLAQKTAKFLRYLQTKLKTTTSGKGGSTSSPEFVR